MPEKFVCVEYDESYSRDWDKFVESSSNNGTFLHTRRFLSYHENRFRDMSLLIYQGDRLVAVFPASLEQSSTVSVLSHPGITFGGLCINSASRGEAVIHFLGLIKEHYKSLNVDKIKIKVTPSIYSAMLIHDDSYAMFRLGARRYRCDISATIDLSLPRKVTKGRKYEINKGKKNSVEIIEGIDVLDDVYLMLQESLLRRHAAKPVHSKEEIALLHERFPEDIIFLGAMVNGSVLAGLIMFNHKKLVAHTQYIASYQSAHEFGALDYLIESAILHYQAAGFRYFDFGISNENNGLVLNENLYRHKRSFGAGSVVHDFYEMDLREG